MATFNQFISTMTLPALNPRTEWNETIATEIATLEERGVWDALPVEGTGARGAVFFCPCLPRGYRKSGGQFLSTTNRKYLSLFPQ